MSPPRGGAPADRAHGEVRGAAGDPGNDRDQPVGRLAVRRRGDRQGSAIPSDTSRRIARTSRSCVQRRRPAGRAAFTARTTSS